jgi:hypothetical protein
MSLALIILERGARPPLSAPSTPAAIDIDEACVVVQQPDEDDRAFRQRVNLRLGRLNRDGQQVTHAELCLSDERSEPALERRFALARTLLRGLATAHKTELVLGGDLGHTKAGKLDLGALVETLRALPLGWATQVRARFENTLSLPMAAAQ